MQRNTSDKFVQRKVSHTIFLINNAIGNEIKFLNSITKLICNGLASQHDSLYVVFYNESLENHILNKIFVCYMLSFTQSIPFGANNIKHSILFTSFELHIICRAGPATDAKIIIIIQLCDIPLIWSRSKQ